MRTWEDRFKDHKLDIVYLDLEEKNVILKLAKEKTSIDSFQIVGTPYGTALLGDLGDYTTHSCYSPLSLIYRSGDNLVEKFLYRDTFYFDSFLSAFTEDCFDEEFTFSDLKEEIDKLKQNHGDSFKTDSYEWYSFCENDETISSEWPDVFAETCDFDKDKSEFLNAAFGLARKLLEESGALNE